MPPELSVLSTFVSITIATIGIVNSLVLSRFNERSSRKRSSLSFLLSAIEGRTRELPYELGEQSRKELERERENTRLLTTKSKDVFLGLPPLGFFLASFFMSYFIIYPSLNPFDGLQLDSNLLELATHILFIGGVLLLIPYVIAIMLLLWAFLKLFSRRKCEGELRWVDPKQKGKEIARSFSKEDILRIRVLFEGFVTNGFIDTLMIYTNGEREFQIWVPDKSTYLSPTDYDQDGVLLIRSSLDTGILQGYIKHTFPLEFRVGESSHKASAFVTGRDIIVFENYFIPPEMKIKELRIRMYVDPLFRPRLDRYFLDELIVKNTDTV